MPLLAGPLVDENPLAAGKASSWSRAVKTRGHFPTEQAAMRCLYMVIIILDPAGRGRKRWSNRWKAALNAFDITFDGRFSAAS